MKSFILNVRIPLDLKESLDNTAYSENVSVSDLVRDILKMHAEESNSSVQQFIELMKIVKYESNDFIYCISWLYEKRYNCYDSRPDKVLYQIKDIVLRIIKDDNYPENLRREFEKVLVDIIRYCGEPDNGSRYFQFGISNHATTFDYNILHNFINQRGFSFTII